MKTRPLLAVFLLGAASMSSFVVASATASKAIRTETFFPSLPPLMDLRRGGFGSIGASGNKSWPFSGKNRAQRHRLVSGFSAMGR